MLARQFEVLPLVYGHVWYRTILPFSSATLILFHQCQEALLPHYYPT
ncbi:MAG: hypothetical protein RMJ87_08660 [Cytophagales bacterium]|nr:hypothetical protein [Cytophagales bacterium]